MTGEKAISLYNLLVNQGLYSKVSDCTRGDFE